MVLYLCLVTNVIPQKEYLLLTFSLRTLGFAIFLYKIDLRYITSGNRNIILVFNCLEQLHQVSYFIRFSQWTFETAHTFKIITIIIMLILELCPNLISQENISVMLCVLQSIYLVNDSTIQHI